MRKPIKRRGILALGSAALALVFALERPASAAVPIPPDELDVFRVATPDPSVVPHITMLIDDSSSLNGNSGDSTCTWFANHYGLSLPLTYKQLLQATLTGCTSATDGLFTAFAGQVAIAQMTESGVTLAGFSTDPVQQANGILSLVVGANTPLVQAQYNAGAYAKTHLDASNFQACSSAYTLVISRGHSSGGGNVTFDLACDNTTQNIGPSQPGPAAKYLHDHNLFCNIAGDHRINTYAVGIAPSPSDLTNLQSMATNGGGQYFDGSTYAKLKAALETLLSLLQSRSAFTFSAVAIQRNSSFFAGSAAYVSSYQLEQPGEFFGNMKKNCILPTVLSNGNYDTTQTSCLFKSTTGTNLLTNPLAVDTWTNTATVQVNVGGTGSLLLTAIGTTTGFAPPPRNLMSWTPGGGAFKSFTYGNFSDDELWVTAGDRYNFINRIYGYTWENDPLGTPAGKPINHDPWVQADTIHPDTTLVQYGTDCSVIGSCYAIQASNDGMIRFVDAANGKEFAAVIPPELFKPTYLANKNLLRDLRNQPSNDGIHRYYVDGGFKLFHTDMNGNGIVDNSERAYLIAGLGRGGRAYYKINLSSGLTAALTNNQVYPLPQTAGNAFSELRQTWATPWTTRAQVLGALRNVAVFPSGHISDFDFPTAQVPNKVAGPPTIQTTVHNCTDVAGATACNQYYAAGYPDPGVPQVFGPYSSPNAIAYKFHFSTFDVSTTDYVAPQDGQGISAASLVGSGTSNQFWSASLSSGSTPYVYDKSAQIYWNLDGTVTTNTGWTIDTVTTIDKIPGAQVEHFPSIYVVDLDNWNGNSAFAANAGTGGLLVQLTRTCPASGGAVACIDQNSAPDLKYMTCPITANPIGYTQGATIRGIYIGDECAQIWKVYPTAIDGTGWTATRLLNLNDKDPLDQSAPLGNSKDFRKIFRQVELVLSSCPGPELLAIYFGTGNVQRPTATDELQDSTLNSGRDIVGVFWDDLSSSNKTTANLYNVSAASTVDPKWAYTHGYNGWYWRLNQNERMLRDPLVFLGVAYFKTHTADNPTSGGPCAACDTNHDGKCDTDECTATGLCGGCDVNLDGKCTPSHGECGTNPSCGLRSGLDTVYTVDNCTAAAVGTQAAGAISSRDGAASWQGQQDIGGNLLLITPQVGQAFVSAANMTSQQNAAVYSNPPRRTLRMLLWRKPRGYER
jgi:hypothetical protein